MATPASDTSTKAASRRRRLPLLLSLTIFSGVVYLSSFMAAPTLEFHQRRPSIFPAPSFQVRRGFVNVLRWLESLRTREDLLMLAQLLAQAKIQARTATDKDAGLATQVATAAAMEHATQLSHLGLQCGLVLYLHREHHLSKKRAIPIMCLCVLSLLCWKMAQTCVREILAPSQSTRSLAPRITVEDGSGRSREDMTAAFLDALFVVRYGALAVVNAVIGRAYQTHLCDPWPEKWRRVPGYLGSKNLVLGTLFFVAAGVGAMSVSVPPLRSLSEAATHIETLALAAGFGHFVVVHFFTSEVAPKTQVKSS